MGEQSDHDRVTADRLRQLYELQVGDYPDHDALYHAHLQAGVEVLGLSLGIVSEIRDGDYTVLAAAPAEGPVAPGDVFPLGETYCAEIARTGHLAAHHHVGAEPDMQEHPVYQQMRLESYIGAPIWVRNELFGTLNFSAAEPQGRPFSEIDREFLELMARGLGSAIEREQLQGELETAMARTRENAALFEGAFNHVAVGKVLVGPDGRWLRVNNAVCEILGYSQRELQELDFPAITHPDDIEKSRVFLDRLVAGTYRSYRLEKRYLHRDGHVIWALVNVSLVRNDDGSPRYFIAQIQDITELKEAELARTRQQQQLEEALARMRENAALFEGAFNNAAVGKALVAPDGKWLRVNAAISEILGYGESELLAIDFQSITHPDDLESDLGYVREMLVGSRRAYRMEKRYVHREGHTVWALLSVSLVRNEDGSPRYFISQIQDISERKEAELELSRQRHRLEEANRQLRELATRDPLTGLPNRRAFWDKLRDEIARLRRGGAPLAVAMIDVDHFKSYNDSFGHDAGDAALCAIASAMRAALREPDLLARHGGEEFALLLVDSDAAQAAVALERLRERVEAITGLPRAVTVSIGYTSVGQDEVLAAEFAVEPLLRDADQALYEAKAAGRNRARFRRREPERAAGLAAPED